MDYELAKQLALDPDVEKRRELAANTETPPEVLFFLANDRDKDVRLAIALNPQTPPHAAQVLAEDLDSEIRVSVAMKIARLFPHLSETQRSQLYDSTVKVLEKLVLDQIVAVRAALSSSLSDFAGTPPHIARQLAKDVEREVAEPILRSCVVLTDQDLLEIIGQHPWPWVLVSIASRPEVSEDVSTAIVDTDNVEATEALLVNEGAVINKTTLERIRDIAETAESLQEALKTYKAHAPKSFSEKVSGFVGQALRNVLGTKREMDEDTLEDVDVAVKRRLEHKAKVSTPSEAARRAQDLFQKGSLTETVIGDALAMHDDEFVYAALVCLAKTPLGIVKKIFSSHSAKGIVALCWKAGISPRFSLALQKSHIGCVQPKHLMYPKDGDTFPLTEDEMRWNLEFFSVH